MIKSKRLLRYFGVRKTYGKQSESQFKEDPTFHEKQLFPEEVYREKYY